MMGLRPINIVCVTVLSSLSVVTFTMISQGPLKEVLDDENIFVQSTLSFNEISEPLKWPALVICRSPFDRNTEKYSEFLTKGFGGGGQNFSSQSEFQALLEDAFFTQPDDIVHAIGLGKDSYRFTYCFRFLTHTDLFWKISFGN